MSRRGISDGTRFRVLQRDKFRCRYCGAHGSEAPLHIDHVHPVSAGGGNDPDNLVTACQSCNLGKGASLLERSKPVVACSGDVGNSAPAFKQRCLPWRSNPAHGFLPDEPSEGRCLRNIDDPWIEHLEWEDIAGWWDCFDDRNTPNPNHQEWCA